MILFILSIDGFESILGAGHVLFRAIGEEKLAPLIELMLEFLIEVGFPLHWGFYLNTFGEFMLQIWEVHVSLLLAFFSKIEVILVVLVGFLDCITDFVAFSNREGGAFHEVFDVICNRGGGVVVSISIEHTKVVESEHIHIIIPIFLHSLVVDIDVVLDLIDLAIIFRENFGEMGFVMELSGFSFEFLEVDGVFIRIGGDVVHHVGVLGVKHLFNGVEEDLDAFRLLLFACIFLFDELPVVSIVVLCEEVSDHIAACDEILFYPFICIVVVLSQVRADVLTKVIIGDESSLFSCE